MGFSCRHGALEDGREIGDSDCTDDVHTTTKAANIVNGSINFMLYAVFKVTLFEFSFSFVVVVGCFVFL